MNTFETPNFAEQAVEKIFFGELELMSSIRSMIDASSMPAEQRSGIRAMRRAQITTMIPGMRSPTQKTGKMVGRQRAAAEIVVCENYFIILDSLLDEYQGSYKPVLDLMKKFWVAVRSQQSLPRDKFASSAEEALFLLYRFGYTENIRFSKLHSQATAHFALVEYRFRNGWLIGKYDGQWTKLQTDSEVIHKWVNEKGTNLTLQAYRFSVGEVHTEITGRKHTGM